MLTRTMRPLFVETITSVEQKKRSFNSGYTILNISKCFLNIHKRSRKYYYQYQREGGGELVIDYIENRNIANRRDFH